MPIGKDNTETELKILKSIINESIKDNIKNSEFTKIYEQKKKSSTGKIPQSTSIANNIPQSDNNVKSSILLITNNMQFNKENTNKVLNPNEISKLIKENANTTPIIHKSASTNKVNDGNSHFANY